MTQEPYYDPDFEPVRDGLLIALCRRKRLSPEEAEDFSSHVRLKLLENDGVILRGFEGRCSVETYLTTVITNLFLDYRRGKWGRWRPSAAAKRLGEEAILLEQALYRDNVPFEEAAELLRRNHGVTLSVPELAELAGRLPQRSGRPVEQADEDLERFGAEPRVEERVEHTERAAAATRAEAALREVLAELDTTDRFLIRSLAGGLQVSEIARMLGEEQKPLYRRRERLLVQLRERLEARGLTAGDVADILDWGQAEMDFGLGPVDSEEGS